MSRKQNNESKNIELTGTSSAPGIAFGPVFIFNPSDLIISDSQVTSSEIRKEQSKIDNAIRVVDLGIRKMEQLTKATKDEDTSGILAFHKSILHDPELLSGINQRIRSELLPADRAVYEAFRTYIERLKLSNSAFFKERIPDLKDVRDRLIRAVQQKDLMVQIDESSIVVCRDLTPGEIILFARRNVRAIVSEQGGLTSHASIIANSMGIPFVIGVEGVLDHISSNDIIIVNGTKGRVIINPDDEMLNQANSIIKKNEALEKKRKAIADQPARTACGRRIITQANVELETELDRVADYKADGIGLLRTEAYFLDGENSSDTEAVNQDRDQKSFLQKAARTVGIQNITVRLYDVGGDKLPSHTRPEANPFLGWRGIRILLDKPVLLEHQLELIIGTLSGFECKLSILVPMITNLEEILLTREALDKVLEKYPQQKDKIDFGIMVEVPSTALLAGKLAPHVDFFSIGTNDLTQYTLAADRTNRLVHNLYNHMHPAVWQLIEMTRKAGEEHNKPVSVCGELAGIPVAAALLAGLGIKRLSMNATAIPVVKEFLSKYEYDYLAEMARKLINSSSSSDAEQIITQVLNKK